MTIDQHESGTDQGQSSFESDLAAAGTRGFWSMLGEYEMLEPRNPEKPGIWAHRDYAPLAMRALDEVAIDVADRRNIFFSNPGLGGSGQITSRLLGGVQAINAGEISAVHRHTAGATRVHLEGEGGYTTVEGGRCVLEFGDVVINPNGLWHETGNVGSKPVMWMDILDLPLTKTLNANFFSASYTEADGAGETVIRSNQTITGQDDWSSIAMGSAGGVRPVGIKRMGRGLGSAQLLYKYGPTRKLLKELLDSQVGSSDVAEVEYYDPLTGGPVLRTLDVHLNMLRAGAVSTEVRTTAGTVFCCLEGSGATVVDGVRLEWSEKDIFVAPGWSQWHHENGAGTSVLYAVSDAPALAQLGLLIEERDGQRNEFARADAKVSA